MDISTDKAHRVFAPRIAYLVGVNSGSYSNIIPISNIVPISTSPQRVGVGVYRDWSFCEGLLGAEGFCLSVPSSDKALLVWKMAASYSGYQGDGSGGKMAEFEDDLDSSWSAYGPSLRGALARVECVIERVIDDLGDHVWVIGAVSRVQGLDSVFQSDGVPVQDFSPLMQVTGNIMAGSSPFERMEYFRSVKP